MSVSMLQSYSLYQVDDLIKIMAEDEPPRSHCKIKDAESLVSKLPTRVAEDTKSASGGDGCSSGVKETCSICMDCLGIGSSSNVIDKQLPCSHVFHDGCLAEWLARDPTCPLCRTSIVAP